MKLFFRKIYEFSFPHPFFKYNPYYTFFITQRNYYFILHLLKLSLAKILNIFFFPKKYNFTKFFLINGFYKTQLKKDEYLFKLFDHLNLKIYNKEFKKKNFCLLTNFSFSKEASLSDSQIHLSHIPDDLIRGIDDYLRSNKKFNNIILNYFRCNYRIVNVRAWRYLSNKKKILKTKVLYHYDEFPHKTLKIMAYKGIFSKENSAIDFGTPINNKVVHSIKGKNPVFIFDSNHLYHKADFPLNDRDTIEIVVQPTIFRTNPLYGGYCAGYPLNPFKKNEKIG